MDFQSIIHQFKQTEDLVYLELLNTQKLAHDEILYTINTNKGIHYVFEIDYIADFNSSVSQTVGEAINGFSHIYELKSQTIAFSESNPVKLADVYTKPQGWDLISKYAGQKGGSTKYYFNFLFRK